MPQQHNLKEIFTCISGIKYSILTYVKISVGILTLLNALAGSLIGSPQDGEIVLQPDSFIRAGGASADVAPTNRKLWNGAAVYFERGWIEYEVYFEEAGDYTLSARYSAVDLRLVDLSWDGVPVTTGFRNTNGSWGLYDMQWEDQFSIHVEKGTHFLRLTSNASPHIGLLRFTRSIKPAALPGLEKEKERLLESVESLEKRVLAGGPTANGVLEARLKQIGRDVGNLRVGKIEDLRRSRELGIVMRDLQWDVSRLEVERKSHGGDRIVVWDSNPLVRIPMDEPPPAVDGRNAVSIEALRNEYEPAQICISSLDYEGPVQVGATPLKHETTDYTISTVSARFVGYVPIVTEDSSDEDPVFPDPLLYDQQVSLKSGRTQPVWITIYVPHEATPGNYRGKITMTTNGGNRTIPIHLKVYSATLPDNPSLWMGSWGGDDLHAQNQGYKPGTPEYFAFLKKTTLRNRFDHRARVFSDMGVWSLLSLVKVTYDTGEYKFDFHAFDDYVNEVAKAFHGEFRITDVGINAHASSDGLYGNITVYNPDGTENQEKTLRNCHVTDAAYRDLVTVVFQAVQKHLRSRNWLDKIYFKVCDEVNFGKALEDFRSLGVLIKKVAPEIRLNATIGYAHMLEEDYIDLPLVGPNLLREYTDKVIDAVRRGKEVWAYNSFKDNVALAPLMQTRSMGWVAYRYGLTGDMEWAWAWQLDAWKAANRGDCYGLEGRRTGAGEHFMVYFDHQRKKIADSLRWEMFRESSEDYETLCMLQQAGGPAEEICRAMVRTAKDVESDPNLFHQIRHQMLMELEKLSAPALDNNLTICGCDQRENAP